MTKQQLIDQVAVSTGKAKADVERVHEVIVDKVCGALATGDKADLRGLGIFEVKETKARTGRNPATGESIDIAAGRRATFRPGKELKDRLTGTRRASTGSQ